MTYAELKPYLKAGKIVFRDRFNHQLKQEEVQRRLVDHVRPAKDYPNTLVIVIK